MDDDFPLFIFVVTISALIGVCIGGCCVEKSNKHDLDSVGIDRIEKCHNTSSNWYEIVWKEER